MTLRRFSARAEQEIKKFCEKAVNEGKFCENEEEARDWYLSNFYGYFCSLYDCPIKTTKEFYNVVDDDTIKQALELIPYRYEYHEGANLLACSEEYLYLSSLCDCIKQGKLSSKDYAALCQTLGFSIDTLEDYFNFSLNANCVCRYYKHINKIWESAKELPKGCVCQKYCNIQTNFENKEVKTNEF